MDTNTALFFQIFNLSHKSIILDKIMVFGAEYAVYFAALLTLFLFFYGKSKEKKAFVLAIISAIITIFIIQLIRFFFYEPRPFITFPIETLIKHPADASFPSGHASRMAAITFPYLFYKSKYFPLFLFLMLWVGFSRIFVGVHYPFDVLGGFATGFVSTGIAWQTKNWLKRKATA